MSMSQAVERESNRHHRACLAIVNQHPLSKNSPLAGVCYGAASLAVLHVLSDITDNFNEALALALSLAGDENVSDENNNIFALECFFENLFIFQVPFNVQVLFNQKTGNILQDFLRVAKLLPTKQIEQQGGVVLLVNKTLIANQNELDYIFNSLRKIINDQSEICLTAPCAFMLRNYNHAIMVGYHPIDKIWYSMDINQGLLNKFQHIDDMIKTILFAFSDKFFVMSMQMFVTHVAKDKWQKIVLLWQRDLIYLNSGENLANFVDEKQNSLLHEAVRSDNKIEVDLYLSQGADINHKNVDGRTPLLVAMYVGNKEIIMSLLDKGADVNLADNQGCTPLHAAVFVNCLWGVECLLQSGADKNKKRNSGETPMDLARQQSNEEIFTLLRDHVGDALVKTSVFVNQRKSSHYISSNIFFDGKQLFPANDDAVVDLPDTIDNSNIFFEGKQLFPANDDPVVDLPDTINNRNIFFNGKRLFELSDDSEDLAFQPPSKKQK